MENEEQPNTEITQPKQEPLHIVEESGTQEQSEYAECVIKMRGLPWSATSKDILDFLQGCEVSNGENAIHFTFTKDGRPSGECFVRLASRNELEKALCLNNEHMGKRYIEVFESKASEMDWVCERMSQPEGHEGESVIRLRGLPFGCSKSDIANFFEGLEIAPYGITITLDQDGRCTGDAYVEFVSPDLAEAALKKHKEKIGHRYIEIFKSSKGDIKYVVGPKPKPLMSLRPGPYDRPPSGMHHDHHHGGRARGRGFDPIDDGFADPYDDGGSFGNNGGSFGAIGSRGRPRGGRSSGGGRGGGGGGGGGRQKPDSRMFVSNSTTGHSIHMRGLPFEATEGDIYQFLSPLNPVSVRVLTEPNGRAKGEADVDFGTHEDAVAAMQKDRQNIGHRYIELFLQSSQGGSTAWRSVSPPGAGGYGSGGGGGYGQGRGGGSSRIDGRGGYDGASQFKDGGGGRGGSYSAMPYGGGGGGGGGYAADTPSAGMGNLGGSGGYGADTSTVHNQDVGAYNQSSRGGGGGGGGYNQSGSTYAAANYTAQPQQATGPSGGYAGQQQQQQQQPISGGGAHQRGFAGGYSAGPAQRGQSDMATRGNSDYGHTEFGGASSGQQQYSGGSYQNSGAATDSYGSQSSSGAYSAPANNANSWNDASYGALGGSNNFFGQSSYR